VTERVRRVCGIVLLLIFCLLGASIGVALIIAGDVADGVVVLVLVAFAAILGALSLLFEWGEGGEHDPPES